MKKAILCFGSAAMIVFLAEIALSPASFSQPAPEVVNSSQEIVGQAGKDVAFSSKLISDNHVRISIYVNDKLIYADIDYDRQELTVKTLSRATNAPVQLSIQDLAKFQELLKTLPPVVNTSSRHGEALASLVNLMASAPLGEPVDIATARQPDALTYTSICGDIGKTDQAIYTLKGVKHHPVVKVGPVCYIIPALGRCGAGGGPDPGIGLVQRFTQQCLNHDQCCVASRDRYVGVADVCGFSGTDCVAEFSAAASGFFFAPDCGTTAGKWIDKYSYVYVLTGGDSSGKATAFSGTVDSNPSGCGLWKVSGTRTGKTIMLTAKNPQGASSRCSGSFTYSGAYSDCGTAGGSWTNSSGLSGEWSWKRTNVVGVLVAAFNSSGPSPTDTH